MNYQKVFVFPSNRHVTHVFIILHTIFKFNNDFKISNCNVHNKRKLLKHFYCVAIAQLFPELDSYLKVASYLL